MGEVEGDAVGEVEVERNALGEAEVEGDLLGKVEGYASDVEGKGERCYVY